MAAKVPSKAKKTPSKRGVNARPVFSHFSKKSRAPKKGELIVHTMQDALEGVSGKRSRASAQHRINKGYRSSFAIAGRLSAFFLFAITTVITSALVINTVDAATFQSPTQAAPLGNIPITIWNSTASGGTQTSASIDIDGDIYSGGNVVLTDTATAGMGDVYISSGKSIRIDGASTTTLRIANYNANIRTNVEMDGTLSLGWQGVVGNAPVLVGASENLLYGIMNPTGSSASASLLKLQVLSGGVGSDRFVIGQNGGVTSGSISNIMAASSFLNTMDISAGSASTSGFLRMRASGINVATIGMNGSMTIGSSTSTFLNSGDTLLHGRIVSGITVPTMSNFLSFEQMGGSKRFSVDVTGNVSVYNRGLLKFFPGTLDTGNYAAIRPPSPLASPYTLTLPISVGLAGQVLTNSDGAGGTLAWATIASGITGSGTIGFLPKFNTATNIINSQVFDNGTNVGINATTPSALLSVGGGTNGNFQVDSTGRVFAYHGLAGSGALGYSFLGDTGTGLYAATAGKLTIQTSGSDRVTIDNSGKVGIGSTGPSTALDIRGPIVNTNVTATIAASGAVPTVARKELSFLDTSNNRQWVLSHRLVSESNKFELWYNDGLGAWSNKLSVDPNGVVAVGSLQVTGGTPALGKVLVSDATGIATWGNASCSASRLFKGLSALPYDGLRGGYEGLASPNVCSSFGVTASVCTVEEMLNSIKCGQPEITGQTSGDGWVSGGAPGLAALANDCSGWNSNAPNQQGRYWRFDSLGGKGLIGTCNQNNLKFACCN